MKRIALHWQILFALIAAVVYGIYLREHTYLIAWMGEVFLRALKMIIVPLIISSIISGVTNIGNAKNLGRLGAKTITYYITTSTIAIITGLALVNIFRPGIGADLNLRQEVDIEAGADTLGQTMIKIIPENIFSAMSQNSQMLSIIFFSLLFGYFIIRTPGKPGRILSEFFESVFQVMMRLTFFIIKFTPLGIFGLVAAKVAEQDDLQALMQSMGTYMFVVLLALFIHAAITLPALMYLIGRINPFRHFNAMRTPLITAFSTSSSSATLPLTMHAVENNSGVSNKVTSFTLPLGATINMDGTALYECVAVIFIAQAYGIELSTIQQLIVVVTALLASIGAAGIPMAGLVMITIVLTAVGLPLEGVGLILAVDRILDMFRTSVNVWSDSCGAAIIARSEGEKLRV